MLSTVERPGLVTLLTLIDLVDVSHAVPPPAVELAGFAERAGSAARTLGVARGRSMRVVS